MVWKRLKLSFKKRRVLMIIVVAVFLSVLLLALWWGLLHPIVSKFYLRKYAEEHRGVTYYKNESYVAFESGKEFQKMLNDFSVSKENQVIDFYHVDNAVMDTPFNKRPDVFALDVMVSSEDFQQLRTMAIETAGDNRIRKGNVVIYILPIAQKEDKQVRLLGFCDEYQVVRYIMITDLDNPDAEFHSVFAANSDLNWEIKVD